MPRSCIVLVVDQRYLGGAKTLIHSLRSNGDIAGVPIVVVTADTTVRDDFVIRSLCQIHFLDQLSLDRLGGIELYIERSLPNNPINRQAMMEVRSKYFQKFFACLDFGYERNIFIDCDMVCLNRISPLIDAKVDIDFEAAPALIGSALFEASGVPKNRAYLDDFRRNVFLSPERRTTNFNSGLFCCQGRCLGDAFVADLISTAHSGRFNGDQPVFNQLVFSGKYRFNTIDQSYNVERPFYVAFGEQDFRADQSWIRLLHFTGHQKPWLWFGWGENEVIRVQFLYKEYIEMLQKTLAWEAAQFGLYAQC